MKDWTSKAKVSGWGQTGGQEGRRAGKHSGEKVAKSGPCGQSQGPRGDEKLQQG